MDKDILDENILDENNNPNNDNIDNKEHNKEAVKEDKKTDDIYSDYPKEVVQLLMSSNPLRNREQSQTLKANETKEELFSKTRVQRNTTNFNDNIDENVTEKKSLVATKEKDLKADKATDEENEIFVTEIDDDIDDIAQTVRKEEKKQKQKTDDDFSFDDDVELVQVVRHKSRKKEYKRNFPVNNKSEIRETPIAAEKKEAEKSEKPQEKPAELNPQDKFNEDEKSEFDDLKKKFTEEKRAKRKQAALNARKQNRSSHSGELEQRKKAYKNKADLNEFFEAPRRNNGLRSEKREKLDKGIIAVCGVVALIIVILFVRTLLLSAKVEEAEQKVAEFTQLQEDNEELKLEIVSLQEKLTENGISLLDEPQDVTTETTGNEGTENGENAEGSTGDEQYDTYTVVAGDTLSGISDKVYGNYSGYKKILEANGLTENANLQIGQVLKIPKN